MIEPTEDAGVNLQDHVLVESEVGGRTIAFRAVVVKNGADELWLGLSSPDHRLEQLLPGRPVQLTIGRTGCALVGQSSFVRHLGESRSRIFAVVRTPTFEKVQRRAYARVEVDLSLRFRKLDPLTGEIRGRAFGAVTVNASPGGLLFCTEGEVALGEDLDIGLSLTGDDRISVTGRVTRVRESRPASEDSARSWLVSVKFTRITAVDQQRILRYCLLTEHRRHQVAAREKPASPGASGPVVEPAGASAAAAPPIQLVPRAAPAPQIPAADPAALAAAVARAMEARAARVAQQRAGAPSPAGEAAPPSVAPGTPEATPGPVPRPPLSPIEARLAELGPDAPLVEAGIKVCEVASGREIRAWFDSLGPMDRIGLLTQIQQNMHGESIPGATEPAAARPLAEALGLIHSA